MPRPGPVSSPASAVFRQAEPIERSTRRSRTGILLGLGAVTLLGGVLRFTNLGSESFWVDEALTALAVQGDLAETWHRVNANESAPFLYYMLEWAWAQLFGHSDVALRFPSAVFGTLTIPVAFAAARRLAGDATALIAAALTATSPMLFWYSQDARAYSLYVLLCAVSFWLFLRARDEWTTGSIAAWTAASAAAIATHYLAMLLVAGEAVVLLAQGGGRRRAVGIAAGSLAAATLAMLPHALAQRHLQDWIAGYMPLGDKLLKLPTTLLLGMSDPAPVVVALAVGLVGAGVALLVLRGAPAKRRAAFLAGALGTFPLVAASTAAVLGTDLMFTRNLLVAWVPLAIAIAVALGASRPRWVSAGLTLGLCAIGVWLIIEMKTDERLQRVDFRAAATLIGPPADRIVVSPDGSGVVSYAMRQYVWDEGGSLVPIQDTPAPRAREVVLLEYDAPTRGGWCLGTACTLPPPSIMSLQAPPGFHLVERREDSLFLLRRYRAPRPTRVRVATTNPPLTTFARERPDRTPVAPWR
jgi:dolichyl-phosphate-mannose-protein mannosyltransferase